MSYTRPDENKSGAYTGRDGGDSGLLGIHSEEGDPGYGFKKYDPSHRFKQEGQWICHVKDGRLVVVVKRVS